MTNAENNKGILVKNRNDEYAIIPAEVFAQYKVAEDSVAQVEAMYESDVEGQSARFPYGLDKDNGGLLVDITHKPFNYHVID